MPRIVIYGAGGFGRELRRDVLLATARNGFDGPAFADDDIGKAGTILLGMPVLPSTQIRPDDLCVLSPSSGRARRIMADRCPGFFMLVASSAEIHDGVTFGEGAVICSQAIFTADSLTMIGRHFHCNFQSYAGHDCSIGDFVTLGPRVGINGNVVVEDDVYTGGGAIIRNGVPGKPIRIGAGAVVGMGAVVTKDVPAGQTVVGNPAQPISR